MILNFEKLPRFKSDAYRIIEMIPLWAQAFNVDEKAIIRQIPWAHGWIDSNPRKAPKVNVVRFLFNWMVRAKKYGNLVVVEKLELYQEKKTGDEEVLTGDDFKRMREAIRK